MSEYSDVSPSSSASRCAGESINAGFPSSFVIDVPRSLEAVGAMAAVGGWNGEQLAKAVSQLFGAYHAGLRVAERGSATPSVASSASSAPSGAKMRQAIGGAARSKAALSQDWRKKSGGAAAAGVASEQVAASGQELVKRGGCYAGLFESGVANLGEAASFYNLLAEPANKFVGPEALAKLRFDAPVGGVVHLGSRGDCALEVLRAIAAVTAMPYTASGSMWRALRQGEYAGDFDKKYSRRYQAHYLVAGPPSLVSLSDLCRQRLSEVVRAPVNSCSPVLLGGSFEAKLVAGFHVDLLFFLDDQRVVGFLPVHPGVSLPFLTKLVRSRCDAASKGLWVFALPETKASVLPDTAVSCEFMLGEEQLKTAPVYSGDRSFSSACLQSVLRRGSDGPGFEPVHVFV